MNGRLKEVYIKSADPFERGRQHGAQVKEEIEKVCKGYLKSFERKGYTWEEAGQMAMEYVPYLEEYLPGRRIATVCCIRQDDISALDEENAGRADFIIAVPVDMTMTY